MRSRSAVDRWFISVAYGGSAFLFAAITLVVLTSQLSLSQIIQLYALVLVVAAVLLWIIYGTYYELRETCLYCRSGPLVAKIGYDSISKLGGDEDLFYSLALSPRRFAVSRRDKGKFVHTIMISPENKEIFYASLYKRCHHLDKPAENASVAAGSFALGREVK